MKRLGNDDAGDFMAKSAGVKKLPAESILISNELRSIAAQIASCLHLEYAGIDLVRDRNTKRYYLLEANVSGGWQNGYKTITGDDVPAETVQWFIDRFEARKVSDLEISLKLYLHHRMGKLTRRTQRALYNIFNSTITPIDVLSEKELYNGYTRYSVEQKLEFLYTLLRQNKMPKLASIILSEAEQSVSWAGNFLIDRNARPECHTLEDGAIASAYYIAIKQLLAKE
jgi:hypothetical protein